MNWLDSARISSALIKAGHKQSRNVKEAETVFINSCTVTANADKKSTQAIKQAEKYGKNIVVLGCSPKVKSSLTELKKQFPEILIFTKESDLLKNFGASKKNECVTNIARTRLPIAIQTGCDCKCAFCITQSARGPHRSFPLKKIIKQIKHAESLGVKEIILTGINIGAWGCTNSNISKETKLGALLKEILRQSNIPRIRLSSLDPNFLNTEFFEVFCDNRICDYLHLSIQSGSDKILKSMARHYSAKKVIEVTERARKIRPNVAITADLIVGFPGESEKNFQETIALAKKIKLAKLHVFPFSPRTGTPAADFPDQIKASTKKERSKKLRTWGKNLRAKFLKSQIGKYLEILVENKKIGLSKNYIRINMPKNLRGDILKTKLTTNKLAKD